MSNRLITKVESQNALLGAIVANFMLNKRDRILEYKDASNVTVKGSNRITLEIGGKWFYIDTDTDVSTAANLDTGTVAAGKDYYLYACDDAGALVFLISLNSSYPSGYTADTSRKIGSFHTLCVNVGTIAGHPLSGAIANSILPKSVWDLKHRPRSEPEGMVFSEGAGIWVDIYLASGTGSSTSSVYNGTISDNRNWMDFVDDFGAVKKQLLSDAEFQLIAAGSNEETNISGSANPGTTGGHSDTAGRRIISNIGCEDCAGVMWQWLRDQSWRLDGVDLAACKTWAWYDLPGAKGSLYREGDYGDVKLIAGGDWVDAANCGSRGRDASGCRWSTGTSIGGRGRSLPQ